jgi:purine-binding chemotaxis protein CheW
MRLGKPQTTQEVLILRAGSYVCGIPSDQIAELILMPALIRLPGQPAILDGFMNLRGTAVPVASLLCLFQQSAQEPDLHSPLVAIRTSHGILALRVDRVEEVATVERTALLPYGPADSLNACAEAHFHWNGQVVALLSPQRLLLTKERDCVADLQAQMQRRLENLEAPSA